MTAQLSEDSQLNSRQRRRRLLLFLLLALVAMTWLFPATSAGLSEGFPSHYSPAPTPAASGATASSSPVVSTPTASGLIVGSGTAEMGGAGFTISGGGASNLRLGVATVIRLTLTNPNEVPIYVTALTVTVSKDSSPAGCRGEENIRITQSDASTADPITVPAGGVITLTSAPRAPQITLLNLPQVNQDACKGKVFDLAYGGSAHS